MLGSYYTYQVVITHQRLFYILSQHLYILKYAMKTQIIKTIYNDMMFLY